jgi:FixJ family two-component response regulator
MSSADHNVAIIDDDDSSRRALSRLLRTTAFAPTPFRSAEDYLASTHQQKFLCLLVDVQLGRGMSGLELRPQLLQRGDATPLIFITAHDEPAARREAERLGCAGFFRKTDPGAMIIEAIRRVASASAAV